MSPFLYLVLAIGFEVIGTSALRASEGFSRPLPIVLVILGYAGAFALMSQALKLGMSMGVAYAIWGGLGTVGIVVIGALFFRETFDLWKLVGIGLIIAGVLVLNLLGGARAGEIG